MNKKIYLLLLFFITNQYVYSGQKEYKTQTFPKQNFVKPEDSESNNLKLKKLIEQKERQISSIIEINRIKAYEKEIEKTKKTDNLLKIIETINNNSFNRTSLNSLPNELINSISVILREKGDNNKIRQIIMDSFPSTKDGNDELNKFSLNLTQTNDLKDAKKISNNLRAGNIPQVFINKNILWLLKNSLTLNKPLNSLQCNNSFYGTKIVFSGRNQEVKFNFHPDNNTIESLIYRNQDKKIFYNYINNSWIESTTVSFNFANAKKIENTDSLKTIHSIYNNNANFYSYNQSNLSKSLSIYDEKGKIFGYSLIKKDDQQFNIYEWFDSNDNFITAYPITPGEYQKQFKTLQNKNYKLELKPINESIFPTTKYKAIITYAGDKKVNDGYLESLTAEIDTDSDFNKNELIILDPLKIKPYFKKFKDEIDIISLIEGLKHIQSSEDLMPIIALMTKIKINSYSNNNGFHFVLTIAPKTRESTTYIINKRASSPIEVITELKKDERIKTKKILQLSELPFFSKTFNKTAPMFYKHDIQDVVYYNKNNEKIGIKREITDLIGKKFIMNIRIINGNEIIVK